MTVSPVGHTVVLADRAPLGCAIPPRMRVASHGAETISSSSGGSSSSRPRRAPPHTQTHICRQSTERSHVWDCLIFTSRHLDAPPDHRSPPNGPSSLILAAASGSTLLWYLSGELFCPNGSSSRGIAHRRRGWWWGWWWWRRCWWCHYWAVCAVFIGYIL